LYNDLKPRRAARPTERDQVVSFLAVACRAIGDEIRLVPQFVAELRHVLVQVILEAETFDMATRRLLAPALFHAQRLLDLCQPTCQDRLQPRQSGVLLVERELDQDFLELSLDQFADGPFDKRDD